MSRFDMFPTLTRELSNEAELVDVDEFTGVMRINGALVISGGGGGRTFTGCLGEGYYEEDSSDDDNDVEDSLPWDSIAEGHGVKLVNNPKSIKIEILPPNIREEGGEKKRVMYPVMVMRTGDVDCDSALVYRRYTEFATLFKKIKKHNPELLADFDFPSKVFGKKNYESEVIENRRRSFERFLGLIYTDSSVYQHEAFREFFYLPGLREACLLIKGGQYRESLKLLLNALHLQVKLCDKKSEIVATLCNIVDVDEAMHKTEDADRYASAALELLDDNIQSSFMIPLLNTSMKLREKLQKDPKTLKRKLKNVERMSGIEVPNAYTLRELSVTRFKS